MSSMHREQRITGILVFALTGVSIFLAPILKVLSATLDYVVFVTLGSRN